MKQEKEMINDYIVENVVRIGNSRYIFAIHSDPREEQRFLKCKNYNDEIFTHYENVLTGDDFVSMMRLYLKDISDAVENIERERKKIGMEDIRCLTLEDLIPSTYEESLLGKVVAISEKYLYDGYKDISHQLFFVNGGSGAVADSRGNACFCRNLYTGEKTRIERYEVLGTLPDDAVPDYAKEHLKRAKEEYENQLSKERAYRAAR